MDTSTHHKLCPRCKTAVDLYAEKCPQCGREFQTRYKPPEPEKTIVVSHTPGPANPTPILRPSDTPSPPPVDSPQTAAVFNGTLAVGIASIVASPLPVIGICLGILAVVTSTKETRAGKNATAALVCGIVGLCLSTVFGVGLVIYNAQRNQHNQPRQDDFGTWREVPPPRRIPRDPGVG